ncbi:acetylglutamate kinase [Legionella sp. D16C41]|uniref:acetylglutamate kinase n=1 Tax=Legionella sp. D16C41 TaxID=3402688 RepID=UPI003AF4ADAD
MNVHPLNVPANTGKLILIKAGGSILQDSSAISTLCGDLKTLLANGYQVALVHGGSKAINEALNIYGIPSEFINGLRVTSQAAMKIIEMVLCGQVNQMLVRALNQFGIKAMGLSGAENQLLHCDYLDEKFGFVGKIKQVNSTDVEQLLANNVLPVIATVGVDDKGQAVNINGDIAACHLATALAVDELVYLTDQEGIYNQHGALLSKLSANQLQLLIKKAIVSNGMLVKVNAILNALEQDLDQIRILNGRQHQILVETLLHGKNRGTMCLKN